MAKATIRMLRDDRGSEDGFTVNEYLDGKQYEVDEALADAFARSKSAVVVKHFVEAPETASPVATKGPKAK